MSSNGDNEDEQENVPAGCFVGCLITLLLAIFVLACWIAALFFFGGK